MQATFCRAAAGVELPLPVHSLGGHWIPAALRLGSGRPDGELHLQELRARGPNGGDDPGLGRVHPPVQSAHPAGTVCENPPLRAPGKSRAPATAAHGPGASQPLPCAWPTTGCASFIGRQSATGQPAVALSVLRSPGAAVGRCLLDPAQSRPPATGQFLKFSGHDTHLQFTGRRRGAFPQEDAHGE
jgi:hypothetical protein